MGKTQRRRAKLYNAFVEDVNHRELFKRGGKRCGICGERISLAEVTIDHIIPLSKGGLHSYANCQPSHERCNLDKGDQLPEEYVPLAVPRRHNPKGSYVNRDLTCFSK